ncbi:alanine--tRNA ligase [Candidatus Woesebacteria bacterium]|nr:alanine--tRNA ligase [Candidatus Woesebacteria bacterium]
MKLSHKALRQKYADHLIAHKHVEAPPISLVPQDDPTTLFTGSGMQQFVPYLLGKAHPLGTRLFNIQPCIRVQDIEEVGDNRHDTFFEMMGNWSLGDYFKKEQLSWFFAFLTDTKIGLGLEPERLYVTVFQGDEHIPKDAESIAIWQELFSQAGVEPTLGERIVTYDATKNWWSRAGVPDQMPAGEPGGPDSEVFYRFDLDHDPAFGTKCHPNCDCGRFLEIGNSVFMQYKKNEQGAFDELPKKNVDFGGGLERLLSAGNNEPDMFKTDVFTPVVSVVENAVKQEYHSSDQKPAMRIIADHIKTATFIIKTGVTPSNKEQGYVLRRLLRRAMVKIRTLNTSFSTKEIEPIVKEVVHTYDGIYFEAQKDSTHIIDVVGNEVERFKKTLEKGMREIEKRDVIDGKGAFDLYQSYGFPFEITQEIVAERGQDISEEEFEQAKTHHQEVSRTSAKNKFRGGLADHAEQTIKYHTATHLIHQALFDVVGEVRQEGSNITAQRLRFDFYTERKPTDDDIKTVEKTVNHKITEALPVRMQVMDKQEAMAAGARAFFKEKYPEKVNVYYIGDEDVKKAYSKELCGGPHVKNTKEIGSIKIVKLKKIGSNMYRLYAE